MGTVGVELSIEMLDQMHLCNQNEFLSLNVSMQEYNLAREELELSNRRALGHLTQ